MRFYLSIFILYIVHSYLLASEPLAIISKVRGKVNHKMVSDNKYRSKTKLNTPILSDMQIRTKSRSFSKISYLDDGTIISMYSETEIVIKDTIKNRIVIKNVELLHGIIRVNVANQKLDKFKLTTPYSKLNCNRCIFWVISDEESGDQFINESGNAEVWNLSSDQTQELTSNSSIFSKGEIKFDIITTPITDLKLLESLMLDVDENTIVHNKEDIEEQSSTIITNIVVIKLKNAANIEREIIVTYTQ